MATHSSILAWRIPGVWEPGGLLSMGSHRVGHDWSDLAAAANNNYSLCFLQTEATYAHLSIFCFVLQVHLLSLILSSFPESK